MTPPLRSLPATTAVTAAPPRLTRAQRAKVRSLMQDEGETRAAAVAWVLAFEPGCEVS